jgi:hypothetical protein
VTLVAKAEVPRLVRFETHQSAIRNEDSRIRGSTARSLARVHGTGSVPRTHGRDS